MMLIWSTRLITPLNDFFSVGTFLMPLFPALLYKFLDLFDHKLPLYTRPQFRFALHRRNLDFMLYYHSQQFLYLPFLRTVLWSKLFFLIHHSLNQCPTIQNFFQVAKIHRLKKYQRFHLHQPLAFKHTAVAFSDPQHHWFQWIPPYFHFPSKKQILASLKKIVLSDNRVSNW